MQHFRFSYPGRPEPGSDTPRRICGDLYTPNAGVPVRAVIQFVHGLDEHFGRYGGFARFLCGNGIVLCGEDHRGHGRSVGTGADGQPLYGSFSASGNGWGLILSDLFRLRGILRKRYPGVPYILMGHSMGSFLVRSMLIACRGCDTPLADGVILSGTAYHEAAVLETGRALVRGFIAKHGREVPYQLAADSSAILYNLRIRGRKTPLDWLSSDADAVAEHLADPHCGHAPTAGMFDDMLGGLLAVCAGSLLERTKIDMPALFIAGKDDPVGDYGLGVRKTAAQFTLLGCPSVTTKLYAGARHEVLFDTCRVDVYRDILDWTEESVLSDAQK